MWIHTWEKWCLERPHNFFKETQPADKVDWSEIINSI